jgi:microcystin-dependent protein
MSDPILGEIRMFAGNFPPRGWAFCNGQILPISQNTALFSLLGVQYGGNGTTTFALPNLQGRAPLGQGQGPGLTNRDIGELGGEESLQLLTTQMPAHSHAIQFPCNSDYTKASQSTPVNGAYVGADPNGAGLALYSATANASMGATVSGPAGSSLPHQNMQPYLALSFIIATQGVFPQRP